MPKYFPHVDGLRSVAVLAVIIYHLNSKLLPGGFVGVDIFFAISGFVVTASLANHKGESFLGFLGFFYSRRLARITPALVVMLFVTTVAYVLFVPRSWFNEMADTVGQAAFWGVSNWILDQSAINYFEPRAEFNPFTHTWSLGVEEQYYLVAPLLLFKWISWRAHSPRRKLAIGIMALLAAISLSACIYFAILHGPRFVFYQITFRFWELAAGVIWYQLMAEQANFGKNFDWFWDIGGWLGLFIIAILFFLPNPEAYPWIRGLFAVIGSVLLIGSPKRIKNDGIVKRVLGSQSMVWIGLRSYSLYLWHWPIYVLFRWTVGLELWPFNVLSIVLIVLIATFSYRWIEQPIRQSTKLK
ncbi:MAG: acyltransferase family protein, partial [Gammaproteobacteria bacterium]